MTQVDWLIVEFYENYPLLEGLIKTSVVAFSVFIVYKVNVNA